MRVSYCVRWLAPALAVAALLPMAAGAQERVVGRMETPMNSRLITVNGKGEVRRAPDIVTLSLGIEERGPDVAGPRERAAQKAQAAIQALRSAGVKPEEIQTSRYTINRQWIPDENQPNPNRQNGKWMFVVNNTVSVRTGMVDKAGDLLDAVVKAGFNDIRGPYFDLRDRTEAERAALRDAIEDARGKADVIAKASGVTIVGLESANEGGTSAPQPVFAGAMMRAAAADMSPTPTPIESGEITVTSNVTAAFRF